MVCNHLLGSHPLPRHGGGFTALGVHHLPDANVVRRQTHQLGASTRTWPISSYESLRASFASYRGTRRRWSPQAAMTLTVRLKTTQQWCSCWHCVIVFLTSTGVTHRNRLLLLKVWSTRGPKRKQKNYTMVPKLAQRVLGKTWKRDQVHHPHPPPELNSGARLQRRLRGCTTWRQSTGGYQQPE
jgi:hypothetical protein